MVFYFSWYFFVLWIFWQYELLTLSCRLVSTVQLLDSCTGLHVDFVLLRSACLCINHEFPCCLLSVPALRVTMHVF